MKVRDINKRFRSPYGNFIIFWEATRIIEPSKSTFHNPTVFDDMKARRFNFIWNFDFAFQKFIDLSNESSTFCQMMNNFAPQSIFCKPHKETVKRSRGVNYAIDKVFSPSTKQRLPRFSNLRLRIPTNKGTILAHYESVKSVG